jgi:hypothetical protein
MIDRSPLASTLSNVLIANGSNGTGNSVSTLYGGTTPTTWTPGQALRQVAGVVSDSSFAQTPPDGTMALDTASDKLYV